MTLSRSALEATFLGLYCLFDPDAEAEVDRAVVRSLRVLLTAPVSSFMSHEQLAVAFREEYGPQRPLPVWLMIERTVETGGPVGLVSLYRNFYDPTSNLYVHAGPVTLLRHRRRFGDRPRRRPRSLLGTRTAAHIGDVAVGTLASEIARAAGEDATRFEQYTAVHRDRMWAALPRVMLMLPGGLRPLGQLRRAFGAKVKSARRGEVRVPVEEAESLIDEAVRGWSDNRTLARVAEFAKQGVRSARTDDVQRLGSPFEPARV